MGLAGAWFAARLKAGDDAWAAVWFPMVVVTVGLTALAGPLYGVAERAAGDLLDRTPYISSVFLGEDVP